MIDTLKAPVGERGKYLGPINQSEDVLLIRKLLQPHLKRLGMAYLLTKKEEEKGKCDSQLIRAIRVFQEKRLKLLWSDGHANIHKSPAYDGRIDPGDETFLALTYPAAAGDNVFKEEVKTKRVVSGKPEKGLVLAAGKNVLGREEFQRGAKAFCALYKLSPPVLIDTEKDKLSREANRLKSQAVYDAMEKAVDGTLDVIAFFGHGMPDSLPTFGLVTGDIERLAPRIKAKCKSKAAILLYACSAGAFGGFASTLAYAVNGGSGTENRCIMVYGHLNDGHTYHNAQCSYFPGPGYVVPPTSPLFRSWYQRMWHTDLWARFPFMSDIALANELNG